ncbi:MAG: serine/threonine-protein kinase [Candidatus Paceibacterota bacterium]
MGKKKSGILKPSDSVNDTYTVKFFLGEGAFGEVYQVEHDFLGLQVMKVFKEKYVKNTDIKTLMNEAKILAKLNHQNLVRVFEANSFKLNSNEYYYLTLNHISGETLAKRLNRNIRLDVELAISLQTDLLNALSYVHSLSSPIVHRDINPDNFLLSYDDKLITGKLADFGLAQSVGQLSNITSAAGRYLYFAPECFWGSYLPSSDVFSAGLVFYRMLTGILPWNPDFSDIENENPEELATKIRITRNSEPKKPSHYNPDISNKLDNVVLKSLHLSIEHRYPNASEFLNDLNKVSAHK